MEYANPEALVETDRLAESLGDPGIGVVDASWFLPTVRRDAGAEYQLRHIPGAVRFDIDDIKNSDTDLPHMLPSPEKFAAKVGRLGLGDGMRIVVYDALGGYSAAARVWWMFRVFGHHDVALLNGGLERWLKEGRPTEAGLPAPAERTFTATMNRSLVRSAEELLANLESRYEQVIDARSPQRFAGQEPEPRPSKKFGHIPGSFNVPFPRLMDPDNDSVMLPATEIAAVFEDAGIDIDRPAATTCGSGVTAALVSFGLYLLGHETVPVYDGSWVEWGNRDDTPVET